MKKQTRRFSRLFPGFRLAISVRCESAIFAFFFVLCCDCKRVDEIFGRSSSISILIRSGDAKKITDSVERATRERPSDSPVFSPNDLLHGFERWTAPASQSGAVQAPERDAPDSSARSELAGDSDGTGSGCVHSRGTHGTSRRTARRAHEPRRAALVASRGESNARRTARLRQARRTRRRGNSSGSASSA